VSNITLPRAVALHTRDVLRGIINASDGDCGEPDCDDCGPVRAMKETVTVLDAALAEPEETFADSLARRSWEAHRAALAEPEPEPVAWMVYTLDSKSVCVTDNPADFTGHHRALPLYTAPPAAALAEPPAKREPATREQMFAAYNAQASGPQKPTTAFYCDGWREAERFHGITKEDKT
jgi:hypothetical protein